MPNRNLRRRTAEGCERASCTDRVRNTSVHCMSEYVSPGHMRWVGGINGLNPTQASLSPLNSVTLQSVGYRPMLLGTLQVGVSPHLTGRFFTFIPNTATKWWPIQVGKRTLVNPGLPTIRAAQHVCLNTCSIYNVIWLHRQSHWVRCGLYIKQQATTL